MRIKQYQLPQIIYTLCIILLGAALGYFSELLEYSGHHNTFTAGNDFLQGIIRTFDRFSIWIFIATLIAYFSNKPIIAAANTFTFFVAMCTAYFIPKHAHYGYSIRTQLIMWIAVALVATGAAALIQYSKKGKKYSWIIKAMPAAAILGEVIATVKYWLDYYSPIPGGPYEPLKWVLMPDTLIQLSVSLLFALLLLLILPKGKKERLLATGSSILISPLFMPILMLLQ